MTDLNNVSKDNSGSWVSKRGNPQQALKNKGIFDSGCSRHMTGNKDFLTDYQDIDGGFVAFGGSARGGKITGKGKIRTDKLDFEDVFFVKELKFNLFSVSQMCDKKNSVLFTETECLVLSPDFKLLDASQVLLRVPRQSNMYSFDLKNVVPSGDLTCLFAKATIDESKLWHRRLGHVNFKTMNKLVKGNLVRGLPSKIFENDHTCVACQKGKQHKASCKAKLVSSISQPLQMLHMDLFGPTSVRSINHKTYCLVVTDDFSRVLVTKPHNKTSNELIMGRPPSISFMRPFGCPVTILNTLDPLDKFDEKAKEGFLVGYSVNSKALRVFNSQTIKVEENLLSQFPLWSSISSSNKSSDETDGDDTANDAAGEKPAQKPASGNEQALKNILDKMMDQEKEATEQSDAVRKEFEAQCNMELRQGKATRASSSNNFNTVSTPVNTAGGSRIFGDAGSSFVPLSKFTNLLDYPLMLDLEDTTEVPNTGIFGSTYDDDDLDTCNSPYADQVVGAKADFNNMEPYTVVIPIPTTRLHSIHPKDQIIRDPSWVEAMHEELLQFKIQKVWTLVDLPYGKKAIGTKWVYRNKKDERGIMDVKSAFLYGTIDEEVYVSQPPCFVDPKFPEKVYNVEKALYELHQAPRAWYETLSTYLLANGFYRGQIDKTLFIKRVKGVFYCFQMSSLGQLTFFLGLQVKQKEDGIFISQDKYVGEILKKFGFFSIRTANTPMETNKALTKDKDGEDVDVHLYRSMIGSLMYLTSSRPDIMFSVCACLRFQVQPKVSHLNAVKMIFRYLKGRPKLGLWYPKDSPFILEAFLDSDYAGASLDRKSTTGAEYIVASQCCGQVLWIQNQLLDYGYNFMQTKIHVDNESAICVVKNPVYHSKTKHIEIRHHFIRDSYEKRLIEMVKIHTDNNVADLLTKAFDFWNTATSKIVNSVKQIHAIVDNNPMVISESSVRSDILFNDEDAITCLTNDEIFENLALMGYEQLSTKLTFQKVLRADEVVHKEGGMDTGGSPRRQDTMGGAPAQTRAVWNNVELMDNVLPTLYDSPLSGGNIPRSDEGRMELIKELMETCTSLTKGVLALEEAKTAQDRVINRLKLRVKRIEKKRKARTPQPMKRRFFKGRVETSTNTSLGEDASKQGRSSEKTKPMFKDNDFDVLDAEQITTTGPSHVIADQVSTARPEVSAATPSTPPTIAIVFDDEDVTVAMAQTLIKMKEVKAKEKGIKFRNVEEASRPIRSITTFQPLPKIDLKDKAKLDRAQIERQRQEEATNAALTKEFDEIQAYIDADALFAAKLQQEEREREREQFTIEERAQFLVEKIAAQRKFRATQRAVEIRSKPPTKTQLRNLMMSYLKNTGGYKHSQLKGKTYEEIHELYEI
ncbi:putative ribonuclease H-like domain-containing protein [Tanacetum coccineum]|uniref:Ribonuclease H-like domain-containing protein n=1 Tax=Tanacetum coccineum TaxID=301880 RepID=A0ABQ5AFH7_9ASTR